MTKFLCKNIWPALFNKQTDHLWKEKTEESKDGRQLKYILVDEQFRFLSRLSCDNPEDPEFKDKVRVYEAFILGIIRGVLVNLGLTILPDVSLELKQEETSNELYSRLKLTLDFSKLLCQLI